MTLDLEELSKLGANGVWVIVSPPTATAREGAIPVYNQWYGMIDELRELRQIKAQYHKVTDAIVSESVRLRRAERTGG